MTNFHMILNRDSRHKRLVTNFTAQFLILNIIVNIFDMVVTVFLVLKFFETKRAKWIPFEDVVLDNPFNFLEENIFGHVRKTVFLFNDFHYFIHI